MVDDARPRSSEPTTTTIGRHEADAPFDEAQPAAAAFLARYSGRTLDAYRHDLRSFFQWATDRDLAVLDATRPHIEMYRAAMVIIAVLPCRWENQRTPHLQPAMWDCATLFGCW